MASNSPRVDLLERQVLIGGNFDWWQRGVGPTTPSANFSYLADHFFVQQNGYTATQQQSTDVPSQVQSGFRSRYCMLLTNGTGAAAVATSYLIAGMPIEGHDYQGLHGRTNRFQFWCKSSVAGVYSVAIRNGAFTRSYVTTVTINSANVYEKKFIDIPFDNTTSWTFDNSLGATVNIALSGGSNFTTSTLNSFQAGNVTIANTQTQWGATTGATFQLAQMGVIPQDFTQAGSATVDILFQRAGRSIGEELAMLQRYFENAVSIQIPATSLFANQTRASYMYKVTKRAVPTVTLISPTMYIGGSAVAAVSPDVSNAMLNSVIIIFGNTTTQNSCYQMNFDINVDAEL